MGQDPHLQPQLDFPFFLSLTRVTIIAATMIARTALMIIVTIFSAIHANISIDSFHFFVYRWDQLTLTFVVSLVASL